MAKFRPVDPSVPPARDRQPMRKDDGAAVAADQFEDNPWAMVHGGDEGGRLLAASSQAVGATIKQDEPDEAVAVPTPIGCWKVISPDGREERVFKPIPGFEHLFSGPAQPRGVPRLADSPKAVATPAHQPVVPQVPATSRVDQMKKRKRNWFHASGRPRQASDDDDDEEHLGDGDVTVPTVKSYSFYIGNVEDVKSFFRRRLDELTMKPVRPIVTAWVKLLEPKRLTRYGPYHKKLPKEQPQQCLLTLAVDLMLQHRQIDVVKRTMDWATRLRTAAHYAVETTPPDQFSSSKGSAFSERMQERALGEIIPNLFDIALSYQEHLAKYALYEGTNNQDPGTGTRVTWQPLTRPPRQSSAPKKRLRRTKATPPLRVDNDADGSGHETEVDSTATESHLRREKKAQEPRLQMQASGREAVASQQQHMGPLSSATTPNGSFGHSIHALHLGDDMDLDVKATNHVPYHGQTRGQNNLHYNGPMRFSTTDPSYHHILQPQQVLGSFGVIPGSTCIYERPFSMFPAYQAQADISNFGSSAGFPYYHDMFTPSLFDGLPNMSSVGGLPEASHD
ncbi:hypothetical protein G6011_01172 [Alternaria panax]|uniref:Uncharacterized protein n=1 Tax=Alternaria panax TaxID=48097 RepID=A0AAD4IKJ0_9PLEO|nr:hypothetical protein G6011_01172 [Alternaria panax]